MALSKKRAATGLLVYVIGFAELACAQDTASTYYKSRYFVAGFLLRSSKVCGGDWKRTIRASFDFIGTPELKTITKSYPDTIKQWMGEGAGNFNTGVMTNGVAAACAKATETRQKAEAILKGGDAPN